MSNPFIFGGLANMGNSFLKSYQAETDRLDRKAADEEKRGWENKVRSRQEQEWQRKDQIRSALNEGSAAGTLEEFEEPGAPVEVVDGVEAPAPTPVKKFRIAGTDQVFTDKKAAEDALGKFNSPVQRQIRAADRVSKIDFASGLKIRQNALETQKAESLFNDQEKAQIRSTYNSQLVELVPATPDWGSRAAGAMNTIAGKEIAKTEVSPDGKTVTIYGQSPDGNPMKVGTFSNDAAGRLDFMEIAMQRSPEDMVKLLDARRAAIEAERKRIADEERKNGTWMEREMFREGLREGRDSGAGSVGSGGSGRSSGGKSGSTQSSPQDERSKAVIGHIAGIIKELPDTYQMPGDVVAQINAVGESIAFRNPNLTPSQAGEAAFMISTKPDELKPRLDKDSGRVVLGFKHPRNGSLIAVDDFDEQMMSKEDRAQIANGAKELLADFKQQDPNLGALIERSAAAGGKPTTELVDALVRGNMKAIADQYKSANRPAPSDIELNRMASAYVKNNVLPRLSGQISAIARYAPPAKQGSRSNIGIGSAGAGLRPTSGYEPPPDSPAGRAAAARSAAAEQRATREAQLAEQKKRAASAAASEAQKVIQSGDPAAAQDFQSSEMFRLLPSDMKQSIRNIVFGRQ